MRVKFPVLAAPIVTLVLAGIAHGAVGGKKLIEWGFDQPTTAYMRQNIAQMEQTPFDGTVFSVSSNQNSSFGDAYWGSEAFTSAQMTNALADLQATPFHKFTDNFLRLNVTPYGPASGIDWFDNFTTIVDNSRVAAQLAHDGGVKGIIIDTEQYTQQIWDYQKQRDKSTKSFAQYATQTRLRGSQIMQAFQEAYPDLTVFLSLGPSYPGLRAANVPANVPADPYGLLVPFVDGMFDAAACKTKIVDGFELGYPVSVAHDTKDRIEWYMNYIHDKGQHPDWWNVLPIIGADDQKYNDHISAGMGTWMDYFTGSQPWNPDRTDNWFTPKDLEDTLRASLQYVDDYAWIYTEQPRWWTPDGGGPTVPPDYLAAVNNVVPEPSAVLLLLAGGAGGALRRGRRDAAAKGGE